MPNRALWQAAAALLRSRDFRTRLLDGMRELMFEVDSALWHARLCDMLDDRQYRALLDWALEILREARE